MGITPEDNKQNVELGTLGVRVERLEMDMQHVREATAELNTHAATQAENIKSLTNATGDLLQVSRQQSEAITAQRDDMAKQNGHIIGCSIDIKWIRIIGGTLAGIIGTAITLLITGAIKV